jgi:hypothetical protein
MSWSTIFLIIAAIFAALMMLKVKEGERLIYWGAVVFFVIVSWLAVGASWLPPVHHY